MRLTRKRTGDKIFSGLCQLQENGYPVFCVPFPGPSVSFHTCTGQDAVKGSSAALGNSRQDVPSSALSNSSSNQGVCSVLALSSPHYSSGSAPRKEAQACAQLTVIIFTRRSKGPQNNSTPSVNVYAVMKYTTIQQLYIWVIYSFLLTDNDIMKSCA